MKTLSIPGVYLDAIRLQPKLSLWTGVPIFLGIGHWDNNEDEPSLSPKAFTRFEDFEPFWVGTDSYLKAIIQGFFVNGGKLCYVLPMVDNKADTLRQHLEQLQRLEDIDLVCAPDLIESGDSVDDVVAKQAQILEHCMLMGDRFAILDGMKKTSQLEQQKQRLQSSYGALYFPWLSAPEPGTLTSSSPKIYLPPCGHVAGIYARSDANIGVHKAPANELIEGISSLHTYLSNPVQTRLNDDQDTRGSVNFIRSLPGRGIRIWGARTLSPDPKLRCVNVRRLIITVRRWLERHLANLVFEPNTSDLWAIAKRDVTVYLSGLLQQGALRGPEPEKAFYVKCDGENNPATVRDAGQLVVDIGLAPVEPGEFIRVRLVQSAHGSTLDVV